MQTMSETVYCKNHRRKASTALNLCHVCYRKRLISRKKFVLKPLYTLPKKYELSTEINSLSTAMSQHWEIDFIPAIRIKHDACIFLNLIDKIRLQDVHKCSIFVDMILYSNLRTGYVHFQLLYSRTYKDIRLSLQPFLSLSASFM